MIDLERLLLSGLKLQEMIWFKFFECGFDTRVTTIRWWVGEGL